MNEQRRTLAYFVLVLLILLVVAIIGGLSAVLFNMQPAAPVKPKAVVVRSPELVTNALDQVTPTESVHIEIPPEKTPPPKKEEPRIDTGVIPTVCDGYGPQIQGREAYWGPITHEAQVGPSKVRFRLNLGDRQPTAGPNNIR